MLICPKCGNNSDTEKFIGTFCINCAAPRIKLKYPKEISIEECKHCTRIKIKGIWVKGHQPLGDYITSKCKGEFSRVVYDEENEQLVFYINKEGNSIRITKYMDLEKTITTCIDCSRLSGGYYESIIQLRGEKVKVEKYAHKLAKEFGIKLLRMEETKGGIDVYSTDNKRTR